MTQTYCMWITYQAFIIDKIDEKTIKLLAIYIYIRIYTIYIIQIEK